MQIYLLIKRLATLLIVFVVTFTAAIGGIYMFEGYVSMTDPDSRDFWWKYPREPLPISWYPLASISAPTFRLVYPNLDYEGTAPWETRHRVPESRIFHIRSNRFGFYTEFPVDQFPRKQNNEFRIILVGGSGAQGHGGSSNERMMYSVLERKLQQSLINTGYKIRVINLALAGHEARYNSSILRAFGHKLQPDMILAYNGANEIAQFPNNYSDTCIAYYDVIMNSTFIEPHWVGALGDHFPALMYRYGLAGYIKRNFYVAQYQKQATEECLQDLHVDTKHGRLMTALYRDVAAPMFVHHFEAIKRDFCGIPIMIAWQAIHNGERTLYDRWLTDFEPKTNPVAYIDGVNTQEVAMHFYNPENRIIHLLALPPDAKKPTWDDVVYSDTSYHQADGTMTIKHKFGVIPAVYYAMETTPADQTKEVYLAYTVTAIYAFRRQNGVYQHFYQFTKAALDHYMNPYWYFLNVDKLANSIDTTTVPDMKPTSIAVHLDDVGQEVVAGIIHDNLEPIARNLIHDPVKMSCPKGKN